MKYYQVKAEHDQRKRKDGSIYIANELYTLKEVQRLKLNFDFLKEVEVNKNHTHFCFGARFKNE